MPLRRLVQHAGQPCGPESPDSDCTYGGRKFGDVKPIGEGASERRIDWGPGYRIYFGRDGVRLVVLLAGGSKKGQRADIERAKVYWSDYKSRKED